MKYIKIFAIVGTALLPITAWAVEGKAVSAHEQILIDNSKKLNKNLPLMVDRKGRSRLTSIEWVQSIRINMSALACKPVADVEDVSFSAA